MFHVSISASKSVTVYFLVCHAVVSKKMHFKTIGVEPKLSSSQSSFLFLLNSGSASRSRSTANCVERQLLANHRAVWAKDIVTPPPREDLAAPPGKGRTLFPSPDTVIRGFSLFTFWRNKHFLTLLPCFHRKVGQLLIPTLFFQRYSNLVAPFSLTFLLFSY